MFPDKSISIALLISTVFHTVLLLPFSPLKRPPVKKEQMPLQVCYLLPEKIEVKQTAMPKRTAVAARPKSPVEPAVTKPVQTPAAEFPKSVQKKTIEIPKEISRDEEALYIDYYQAIREEIRRFVTGNYTRFIACGEICLYFVLSAEGRLKEIKILDERSSPNRILKEIARKSVHQASPFAPFPAELKQDQLSFNVVISFELQE